MSRDGAAEGVGVPLVSRQSASSQPPVNFKNAHYNQNKSTTGGLGNRRSAAGQLMLRCREREVYQSHARCRISALAAGTLCDGPHRLWWNFKACVRAQNHRIYSVWSGLTPLEAPHLCGAHVRRVKALHTGSAPGEKVCQRRHGYLGYRFLGVSGGAEPVGVPTLCHPCTNPLTQYTQTTVHRPISSNYICFEF